MKPVVLTPAEIMHGADAGIMRHVENIKNNVRDAYGADEGDWQMDIEGALGEYALSKLLNIWWPGKGRMWAADVGNFDVRTTSKHGNRLIIHPKDDDQRFIWLVTGRNGSYRVHGGILAKDGKRKEWWADPAGGRPAYFVPQSALSFPEEHKKAA